MPEKTFLQKLQASFPAQTKSDWISVASTEVNGKEALESLQWEVPDVKIKFSPYYDKSDLQHLGGQSAFTISPSKNTFLGPRTWHSLPFVLVGDENLANDASHNHVMQGADGILFEIRQQNVSIEKLLDKLEWPYCHLAFVCAGDFSITDEISRHCLSKGYNPSQIGGSIFWKKNPIIRGPDFQQVASFNNFFPLGILIESTGVIEQISQALIRGVEMITRQQELDQSADDSVRKISFSVPVGNNFLVEIAKFRALRMLWYQVARAFGVTSYRADDLHIHARCTAWVDEAFQPHGNMLSSTTASISAISGGCNSLTVMSEEYDQLLMTRIARNVSVILREESHLNKVADPVAGSYAIEILTTELAREAWARFQSAS